VVLRRFYETAPGAPKPAKTGCAYAHGLRPRSTTLPQAALDWEGWWSALSSAVLALQPQSQERSQRYENYGTGDRHTLAEFHLGALLESGLAEAEVLWRSHSSSIIGPIAPQT
jgi:hypothetical protein